MKTGFTDITAIIDFSGSMYKIKSDTEGGFNTFLAEQKKLEGECHFSLYKFNSHLTAVYENLPIAEAKPLDIHPSGNTALLDAIGVVITKKGAQYAEMPEEERPEHVVVVIVTDGEENASSKYSPEQIKTLLGQQQEIYKWTFIYLGANQDAITVGHSMGISRSTSMTYNEDGIGATYSSLSRGISDLRMMNRSMSFSDSDRSSAVKSSD